MTIGDPRWSSVLNSPPPSSGIEKLGAGLPTLVSPLRPVTGDLLASPKAISAKNDSTSAANRTVEASFQENRTLISEPSQSAGVVATGASDRSPDLRAGTALSDERRKSATTSATTITARLTVNTSLMAPASADFNAARNCSAIWAPSGPAAAKRSLSVSSAEGSTSACGFSLIASILSGGSTPLTEEGSASSRLEANRFAITAPSMERPSIPPIDL